MRPLPLAAGSLVLLVAWAGPLPARVAGSFTAHMTLHVAVVAVAAPLLALGLAGNRFDPTRASNPAIAGVLSPIPLSLLELVVVWGWHAPAPHEAARGSGSWLVLEQASFLGVGLLLWLASVPGPEESGDERTGAGIVGLLFTSMHMTLLGALLGLAPRALYRAGNLGSMGHLADQHVGGAIMLLVGAASYLAGGLWLAARVLRGPRVPEEARP